MKKRVYIAVPAMRRNNSYARHEADLAMQMLSKNGLHPVNPFHNDPGKGATEADLIADHLRMALSCDMVYFLSGWGPDCLCRVIYHALREWNATHPGEMISIRYGRKNT